MSLNNQVFAAFDAFVLITNGATRTLRQKLLDLNVSVEDAEPIVTEWAGQRHNCPLVEGQRKAKGRKVLDSNAATYEAAKTSRRRVMEALTGDADRDASAKAEEAAAEEAAEEFAVPAEIAAAAAALVALVNEYDLKKAALKSLASRAVAEAFAAVK